MSRHSSRFSSLVALVLLSTSIGVHDAFAAPRGQPDVDEGVQVLTRGPVHEAFAEVIAFNREPGVVVPKAPPDAIEELPPDQRPAGANVAWIPGYWAWDDEGNDYLWVSGLWRFLPPGRQWIAGYWGKSESGYQWTSGYWADGKAREIEYLPEPPEAVNADPDGEAPSEDQTWIPGVRVWNQNRYTSRPGYWAKMQTNWDWIPAHYVWSPRGYVFVDGYWDYSVGRRGVLFAPVSFDAGVYTQPGFTYSPVNVINTATIIGNLFLRPSYGHYYFGDYYAANYDGLGFYPSYSFHNHFGYDPFYAQQRWQNRQDREWEQNVATQFRNRRDNEDARPPRTLAAQNELVKSGTSKDEGFVVARPLSQLTKSQDSSMRFQPVDKQERQKLGQVGTAIGNHRAERQKLEAGAAGAVAKEPSGKAAPAKVKLSASPIVAKAPHQLSGDHVPPKVHETPEPDLKSEPKSAPKVEPKTEPRPVPKVEPKVEPNPAPKAEPKPDTKPAPKVEPKPAPKAEPKPEPKPAPKAEPKPEPKPAPKTEPKSAAPSGEPKKKTSA